MIRRRLIALFVLFALLNCGAVIVVQGPVRFPAAGGGGGALVTENFEGAGEPAGWGHLGTVDYDYTTTVLQGSQSWKATDFSAPTFSYYLFSDQTTVDAYFQFQASTVSGGRDVFILSDSSSTTLARVALDGNFVIWDGSGSHFAQPTDGISANTKYHVWVSYVKGTGANAVLTLAFSTDGTRPVSGTSYCTLTNGDSALNAGAAIIYGGLSTSTHIFDRVIVQATAGSIGNNP